MTSWSISANGGAPQTLSQWGLDRVLLTLQSQAPSTLEFTATGIPFDSAPPFAAHDLIELYRDAVRVFYGTVEYLEPDFGADHEDVAYRVMDPWYKLEQTPYQQAAWHWKDADGVDQTGYSARVNLFQDDGGNKVSIAAQITDILTYASTIIDPVIPLVIGNIEPDMVWVYTQETNITCANAIRLCLRAAPDCTAWWDFSGAGPPTLNIERRSSLIPVSIDVANASEVTIARITPRYDIQRQHVKINFEFNNTWNDIAFRTVDSQIYPPGTTGQEADCFIENLELTGSSQTTEQQYIETEPIDIYTNHFWVKYGRAFEDPHVDPTTLEIAVADIYQLDANGDAELDPDGTPTVPDFTNMVISGAVPGWTPERGRRLVARADLTCQAFDDAGDNIVDENGDAVVYHVNGVTVELQGTDYETGTYTHQKDSTFGETAPDGMAEYLFNALSPLHYQGSVTVAEGEVSFIASIQNTLNLANGQAAWAAMIAQVQTVTFDITFGVTTISFGPPEHLSAQSLMELFKAARQRWIYFNLQSRIDASGNSGSTTQGPSRPANENTSHAGRFAQQVFSDGSSENKTIVNTTQVKVINGALVAWINLDDQSIKLYNATKSIQLKLDTGEVTCDDGTTRFSAKLSDLTSGQTAQFREYAICDAGVQKKVKLLGTTIYT